MILMKHLANHALILTLVLGIIFKQFEKSIFHTCFVCTENFKDSGDMPMCILSFLYPGFIIKSSILLE